MASGFLGVTGARHLERGLEPRPHAGVERVRVDLQMRRLPNPWAQGCIGGTPDRLPEGLCNRGHPLWRPREGRASRSIHLQQGLQAPPRNACAKSSVGQSVCRQPNRRPIRHRGRPRRTGAVLQLVGPCHVSMRPGNLRGAGWYVASGQFSVRKTRVSFSRATVIVADLYQHQTWPRPTLLVNAILTSENRSPFSAKHSKLYSFV
jgi:hypothetical protein